MTGSCCMIVEDQGLIGMSLDAYLEDAGQQPMHGAMATTCLTILPEEKLPFGRSISPARR